MNFSLGPLEVQVETLYGEDGNEHAHSIRRIDGMVIKTWRQCKTLMSYAKTWNVSGHRTEEQIFFFLQKQNQ